MVLVAFAKTKVTGPPGAQPERPQGVQEVPDKARRDFRWVPANNSRETANKCALQNCQWQLIKYFLA